MVYVLFYEQPYEGQQILGVYETYEAAEAARDGDSELFVSEMELGKTYDIFGSDQICGH